MNSLRNQVSQIPTAATEAGETLAQEAARFGELATSWWQRNADVLRNAAVTVRDEASAFGNRTRLYVKDEPVKSVVLAAAVGAVVTGLLMLLMQRDR
jgi:ElaB/YqjD/DUF883 family membrane-anchored ribosome-binding protein